MTGQDSIVTIRVAWQAIAQQSVLPAVQQRLTQSSGLSLPRTARLALAQLAERGELQISELSALASVDVSTMSRSLRHLDDARLIRRHQGEDLRAVVVSITPEGEQVVARYIAAAEQLLGEVLASWSPPDREQFAQLINRFAQEFEAYWAASSGRTPPGVLLS